MSTIPNINNFCYVTDIKNVDSRGNLKVLKYKDKEKKSSVFALYLNFLEMAFCHETLHILKLLMNPEKIPEEFHCIFTLVHLFSDRFWDSKLKSESFICRK